MKKEEKLQSDIARKFSELYPDRKGQLFHVPNERNNKIQAFNARAIGIVPGVSDLFYFELGIENRAIELKVIGSRHKREEIERQIWWAKIFEGEGGYWRLCRTVDEAINAIKGRFINSGLMIEEVEQMLKDQKTKTIKF